MLKTLSVLMLVGTLGVACGGDEDAKDAKKGKNKKAKNKKAKANKKAKNNKTKKKGKGGKKANK